MAINVKYLLANALLELCDEKPLAKLIVQDIIDKSGASRQTFYNHFRDKNDLITWTYCTYIIGDFQSADMKNGFYDYLCKTQEHCVKYRNFFVQACLLEGQNSLKEDIFEQNYRNYLNLIVARHGKEIITEELLWSLRFNAMGAIGMHLKWAKEGMALAPEVKARYVLNCIPEIIKQYLPIEPE